MSDDLRQYLFVIRQLTGREIKRRYVRSYLGVLWSILNPLLNMIIMSLIFSLMFRGSIEKYPLYFLMGSITWELFSSASSNVMSVLVDNKQLLMTVKVPKNVFVLSRCYTALVNYCYSLVPLLIMMVIFGVRPSFTMLLLPVDIVCCLIFSLGVGYILSIMFVFFGDIGYLYSVFLTMLMYMTAIFYPVESVPKLLQVFINNNPVYCYVRFARECMIYGRVPDMVLWAKIVIWGLAVYLLGYLIFRRWENRVMMYI